VCVCGGVALLLILCSNFSRFQGCGEGVRVCAGGTFTDTF